MIKVTFDAPTLADAVAKAARVAPTKGAAYDRAAGLLLDVDPAAHTVILRSTNLDLSYEQILTLQDAKGDTAQWRLPSTLLAGLLSNLPMQSGATVTFYDKGDKAIRVTSGTMTAKMMTLNPDDFPKLPAIDRSNVSDANDFASKVAQVSWACAKDNSIMSGVSIDGESLIACERYCAAIVPCVVPITKQITVPLFLLSPVLRSATEVQVGADDHHLFIALDAESHATGRILEGEYPDVKKLLRDNYSGFAAINRVAFVEVVNRMMVMARAERLPAMTLEFRTGLTKQLVLDLDVPETGRIQDRLDIAGEYEDDFTIHFTPQYIVSAIDNARGDTVRLDFGRSDKPEHGPISPVRVTDDGGYQALVTPRRLA